MSLPTTMTKTRAIEVLKAESEERRRQNEIFLGVIDPDGKRAAAISGLRSTAEKIWRYAGPRFEDQEVDARLAAIDQSLWQALCAAWRCPDDDQLCNEIAGLDLTSAKPLGKFIPEDPGSVFAVSIAGRQSRVFATRAEAESYAARMVAHGEYAACVRRA